MQFSIGSSQNNCKIFSQIPKQIRYGLPQTRFASNSNEKNHLSEKLFGGYALKANLTNQISSSPLIAFCREYRNQTFTGDKLSGFATKLCHDFYLAPTHAGVCSTKNLDLKNIIHLDDPYKIFFEIKNETSELKVGNDNYWAESTFVINPIKIDPMKVILKFQA